MQKSILFTGATLLCSSYFAQITVGTNTLLQVGDVLQYNSQATNNTSYLQNGSNVSWDFSDLINQVASNESVLLSTSGSAGGFFSTATIRFPYWGLEAYATSSNNQIELVGIKGLEVIPSLPMNFKLSSPLIFQKRPLIMGDAYTDQAEFSVKLATAGLPVVGAQLDTITIPGGIGQAAVDSIEILATLHRRSNVVGYGTAEIGGANFSVLKENTADSMVFRIKARATYTPPFIPIPITQWIDVTSVIPTGVLNLSNRTLLTSRFVSNLYKESIAEFSRDSELGNTLTAKYKGGFAIPIGVAELATSAVSVYPNPCTDILFVNNDNNNLGVLTLKDLSGRIVVSTQGSSLDLQTVAAGMYVLEVSTLNGVQVLKIQKN